MPQDSLASHSALTLTEVQAYATAILRGAVAGITNTIDMILHPIDTVLYPISILAYDATIVALKNSPPQPESLAFKIYLEKNPQLYQAAMARMEKRIAGFKQAGVAFMEASGQEKTEVVTEFLTGVLVPGYVFRGIKFTANACKNYKQFGTTTHPPLFHNLHPDDIATPNPTFKTLSAAEIKNQSGINDYIWVMTQKNELLITPRLLEQAVSRHGLKYNYLHHHELALFEPVLAAGELKTGELLIVNLGQSKKHKFIQSITPMTGHYLVQGEHLPRLVETTFTRFGFEEAAGKFKDLPILGTVSAKPKISEVPAPSISPGKEVVGLTVAQLAGKAEEHFQKAKVAYGLSSNANRWAETIAEADKAIALNPKHAGAYHWKAAALQGQSKYPEAIAEYTKAINAATTDTSMKASSLGQRGNLYRATGEFQKGLTDLNEALTLSPTYYYGYYLRSLIHFELGNYQKAKEDFTKAKPEVDKDPKNVNYVACDTKVNNALKAEDLRQEGEALYNKRDFPNALEVFNQARALNDKSSRIRYLQGCGLSMLGKHQEAVVKFTETLAVDPNHVNALEQRGHSYMQLNQLDKAIADLKAAIAKAPTTYHYGHYILSLVYSKQQNWTLAQGSLTQALSKSSSNATYLAHQTTVNNALKAEEHFQKAKAAYGSSSNANRWAETIAEADKAITLNPKHAGAHHFKAAALQGQSKYPEAIAEYTKAINAATTDASMKASSLGQRGNLYRATGEFQKGLTDLNDALTLSPTYYYGYYLRSLIHFELKNYQKAKEDFVKAKPVVDKDPKNPNYVACETKINNALKPKAANHHTTSKQSASEQLKDQVLRHDMERRERERREQREQESRRAAEQQRQRWAEDDKRRHEQQERERRERDQKSREEQEQRRREDDRRRDEEMRRRSSESYIEGLRSRAASSSSGSLYNSGMFGSGSGTRSCPSGTYQIGTTSYGGIICGTMSISFPHR